MKSLTKSIRTKFASADTHVQFSLPVAGVLRDVQSAFYGLCINAGKAVLGAMMEAERTALCGPKGVPDLSRRAYRGGHSRTSVVLGGRRIAIRRPRAHALEAQELPLPTFQWATQCDPLNAATLSAIAAGVSTRRYGSTLDPLPAVMIDGIHFQDRVVLLALGFDAQGRKHVLGLWEGSTEKATVVRALLSNLIERGLDADTPRLWIIDGGKAIRRAILEVFGATALIQRCQEHKRRNVIEHLPDELHTSVGRAMKDAWESKDAMLARRQLERLANSLTKIHPGAAASLREGMEETLTLISLGIDGALYKTLRTTNPIENLNGRVAHHTRNVKRWRDGEMVLRWIAASLDQASRGFRAIRGHRDITRLTSALAKAAASSVNEKLRVA